MTEEDRKEFESFFNEMRKEQKELLSKKEYQITLKGSVEHISNVIKNQATNEQLDEYKKIDNRVQKVIDNIDEIIKNIMATEKTLEDIQNVLEEILKADTVEITLPQTTFLQNEILRYNDKKKEIERQIDNNKVSFVLKELNYFSDKIRLNKFDNIENNKPQEIEFRVQSNDDLLNKIRQSIYSYDTEETPSNSQNESAMEEIKEENNTEVINNYNTINAVDIEQSAVSNKIEIQQAEKEDTQDSEGFINEDKKTNVLIISEREKLVHLPYKQSDIKYWLQTGKFNSKEEIINKVYTIPLSRYANFTIARLTEGFKLMREREKAPLGESLKYAFSLIWERKLHPAIITACRIQDDLDIYLACLEDNMLPLFDSFEIRFEYRPIKARQNNKFEYFEGV